jgi:ubiquinone/menaquinone biosynthesis C-methylase UbiE
MADDYDPRTFVEDHVFEAGGLLGWLTRRRKAAVLELMRAALRRRTAPRVLDIGCGYGDMLAETSAALRVGVDLNPGALARAATCAPGAHFVVSAVERLPFGSETFDGVICSEVLEHLDDPALLAREIVRVTSPGGSYCITVPNEAITTVGRFVLGKRPAKSPAHKQRFTPRTIAALFPHRPLVQRLTPIAVLPFAASTNVVMLFTKP